MGNTLKPKVVISPGEIINMELEERGWNQRVLAEIIGRPYQSVNEIIRGKKQITPETARELAHAFGTSPQLWMNLEVNFRLHQSEQEKKEKDITRRSRLHSLVPLREVIKLGWVEDSDELPVIERRICQFLGIDTIFDTPSLSANFRYGSVADPEYAAMVAWCKRVENLAKEQHVDEYDRHRLEKAIDDLLLFSTSTDDLHHVPNFLMNLGVHFVIVPRLNKTHLDGATFFIEDHPVVALTLRHDRIDYFWFTLLHEIAHILLGHSSHVEKLFDANGDQSIEELEANEWARSRLVEPDLLNDFIKRVQPYFSRKRIEQFSTENNRHPGIILGQLQHRGEVSFKHLRALLVKVKPQYEDWIDKVN